MAKMIGACPVCEHSQYEIVKLRCRNCSTTVEGAFSLSKLGSLAREHQEFIEVFIKCRGNIKDVERELGISYPTVRGRLDKAIRALGYATDEIGERRKEILASLETKQMSPEDAVKALRDLV
jgi:hypothetical protein